jgi:hypothetical protein
MRGLLIAALLSLSACASVVPLSVTALTTMQLRERAGLYPADWIVSGSAHASQLAALKAWAEDNEIVVVTANLRPLGLRGSAQPGYLGGWIIRLDRRLEPDAQLWTLLHELGHIYGPNARTEEEREVIAELVAALVCARVGLNVWPQVTAYVASRAPVLEAQSRIVQLHGAQIDRLVDRLTVAVTSGR